MQNKLLDEVYNLVAQGNFKFYRIWADNIVFSWRWWLSVVLSIVPWIFWIKIRSKNNTARLLFVGLVVCMTTALLDNLGAYCNLWHYDWNIPPVILTYFPWDFTLFPVSVMLLLQFKTNVNQYIKALAFSFMCSFIFEPFFLGIGMYHMVNWEYWYSFVIYTPLYLFYDYLYNCKLWKHQNN